MTLRMILDTQIKQYVSLVINGIRLTFDLALREGRKDFWWERFLPLDALDELIRSIASLNAGT